MLTLAGICWISALYNKVWHHTKKFRLDQDQRTVKQLIE